MRVVNRGCYRRRPSARPRLSASAAALSARLRIWCGDAPSIAPEIAAAVAAAAAIASVPPCVEIDASRAPLTIASRSLVGWKMPTGATRIAAPHPSCLIAIRTGSFA